MLKKLRQKKTAKKIWITLAILIIPAFVLWGFGSVAKTAGKKAPPIEYQEAQEAVKNQAIIQFGDNLSQVQQYLNLESQARLRLALLAEAKKRKIKASDQEVAELIAGYPFFQKNGRFDNALYTQILQYVFHTPARAFEEQARGNLMLSKLYDTLTKDAALSEEEIKEAYRKENEEINIDYIAALFVDFVKEGEASEEEVKDYFAKNSVEFKQPLSFNLEYIALEKDKKNEAQTKDKIKKIVAHLNKEDFTKVAKDFGLTLKETGYFSQSDPIPGIGWSPQALELILKLKTGQVSSPVETDKYYHILKLKEKKAPYIPELEAIKDKVKTAADKIKFQKIAREKIENCRKELKEKFKAGPKIDFAQIASALGLKSGSTPAFKYGSYIEGIGASDDFWTAAQNLKESESSGIINTPAGFYIIKLKTKTPIDENKFRAEKSAFSEKLLERKKQEYFSGFSEKLMAP